MVINLNDLVKVNYKNASFSSQIIHLCAQALCKQYNNLDYKKDSMPASFWTAYDQVIKEYKLVKKELLSIQDTSQRSVICLRYHSLKPVWSELINPSGSVSVFLDNKEYGLVWERICKYYPEMKTSVSDDEAISVIEYAYNSKQNLYPTFLDIAIAFSHYSDKGLGFVTASSMMTLISDRISKAS